MLKRYPTRMSCKDILTLLRRGLYRVDELTGTVYGHTGTPITPFTKDGYLFVRLYFDGNWKRIIGVHSLAWMAKTMRTIPRGFEVHHRDRNPANNTWPNLFCLYRMDHSKLHQSDLVEDCIPD